MQLLEYITYSEVIDVIDDQEAGRGPLMPLPSIVKLPRYCMVLQDGGRVPFSWLKPKSLRRRRRDCVKTARS